MKALSLWQPWASLIAQGHKTVETRSWAAPTGLVGRLLAIQAAKRKACLGDLPFDAVARLADDWPDLDLDDLPYGSVVAVGRLKLCGRVDYIAGVQAYYQTAAGSRGSVLVDPYGDFSVGRYLWVLDRVQPLATPVPTRGRQSVWDLDPEADAAVRAQLRQAPERRGLQQGRLA